MVLSVIEVQGHVKREVPQRSSSKHGDAGARRRAFCLRIRHTYIKRHEGVAEAAIACSSQRTLVKSGGRQARSHIRGRPMPAHLTALTWSAAVAAAAAVASSGVAAQLTCGAWPSAPARSCCLAFPTLHAGPPSRSSQEDLGGFLPVGAPQ